jgi:uncharacterized membrane protein
LKFSTRFFDILPVPFWVYATAILCGTTGLLPNASPVYDQVVKHILPLAIATMLLGVPVKDVVQMGRQALIALAAASGTVFVAQVLSYMILIQWLPDDAWKSVGALLGTWIGGSANMLALKEILQLDPDQLPALIVVDTVLSYSWMAVLLAAGRFQVYFERAIPQARRHPGLSSAGIENAEKSVVSRVSAKTVLFAALIAVSVAELSILAGAHLKIHLPLLSASAWSLLLVSAVSVALSPWVAPWFKNPNIRTAGSWLLYSVLFAIGVRTNVQGTLGSYVFFVYGILTLGLHGFFLWHAARWAKLPLGLVATASQANIGGAASAPIVAEAYQRGTAYLGVLMAVAGAVLGTYVGWFGALLCRFIGSALLGRPL